MKYIIDIFEGEEFWIELDDNGYALRQMIIGKGNIQMSCFTDCLAEGIVDLNELDGEISIIKQELFEDRWNDSLENFKDEWK